MTQEELRNLLIMRHNLNPAALAELEMFFAEHSNVDEKNYKSLLNEWHESEKGKNANAMIVQVLNAEKDSKIQLGLTTIEKGNFLYVNKTRGNYLGTYVVYDNITRLHGLITENGEEVLPCIFDSVSVKLDGVIKVRFKGADYELMFSACDYEPKEGRFCYGGNSAYILTNYMYKRNPSPTLLQLVDLLKKNHTK